MKIAIIGAGKVGATLGQRWSQCGHRIGFGVRDPEDSKHRALHPYAKVTHSLEAVELAESSSGAGKVLLIPPQRGD